MEVIGSDVARIFGTFIRWGAPAAGVVITFLAWWRFRSPDVRLAIVGFALMLASVIIGLLLRQVLLHRTFESASERGIQSAIVAVIAGGLSSIGMVVVVLSMRRMIASARRERPDETTVGSQW